MISVLVRSHNDILYIEKTIASILEQEVDQQVEIISCDDHSTDGTREFLATIGELRRIEPPEGRYIPGKTLNYMVQHSKGEYIVFNNGDAIMQTKNSLKNLVEPLINNSDCDCVFGNQIARKNAYAVVRKDYERAFGDGSISKNWDKFFSLVSSGFRRSDLVAKPFNEEIQYSEDSEWVNRNDAEIIYVANSIVEHSHNYTLKEVRKRFFNEGIADRQMGKKSPGFLRTWRSIVVETCRDWIYLVKNFKLKEFFYAPIYRYVQKMSYYRGTKL